jgi:hypothetical protein
MNELQWLTDQRPEVDEDPVARTRARRALREHTMPRPSRRAVWRPRLAFASVAALLALAAAIAWPRGDALTPPVAELPTAPAAPEPQPLVLLAEQIKAEPAPKGDATLVIRDQRYPEGESVLGYDLYLDDGRYYYGADKAELKGASLNSRYHEPLVEAAIAAPGLEPDRARREMDLAVGGGKAPKVARSIEDNHVWVGSMDALLAGAGRKDVRAGVMMLLHTIEAVEVSREGDLLHLRNTDFGEYAENLYIDARTGVPVKFEGGEPGKQPDVVIDYDVKRVTAATWADAAATDDADQAPAADAGRPARRADPEAAPARKP